MHFYSTPLRNSKFTLETEFLSTKYRAYENK